MGQAPATALVVGAGINGASTAFWLADEQVEVTLLEQGHPASGPTGSSSAVTHAFYMERELQILGNRGIEIMRSLDDIAGGPSDHRDVGMLWVAGHDKAERFRDTVHTMQSGGIEVELLDLPAIHEMAPRFDMSDIAVGVWESHSGYADPVTTTTSLAKGVTRKGGTVRSRTRVAALIHQNARVTGVVLDNGERLYADVVVLAVGPWSRALIAPLGVDLPLTIERHPMAVLAAPGRARDVIPWSWCDDIAGNYARPDGEDIVLAGTWSGGGTGERAVDVERGEELDNPDDPFKRTVGDTESATILATFEKRIPELLELVVRKGYADLYDMSPDDLPVYGGLPGVDGLIIIAGTSGHGFKLGPAVGEAVAHLIVNGEDELLAPFDAARFLDS